jgi:segregation and condensation protein B
MCIPGFLRSTLRSESQDFEPEDDDRLDNEYDLGKELDDFEEEEEEDDWDLDEGNEDSDFEDEDDDWEDEEEDEPEDDY